ncbi:hypothetical protein Avbf_09004 [Armadillidium vulgare]|nr:hypothetical protein Avbf_09004 [Armadillidium vulgare]
MAYSSQRKKNCNENKVINSKAKRKASRNKRSNKRRMMRYECASAGFNNGSCSNMNNQCTTSVSTYEAFPELEHKSNTSNFESNESIDSIEESSLPVLDWEENIPDIEHFSSTSNFGSNDSINSIEPCTSPVLDSARSPVLDNISDCNSIAINSSISTLEKYLIKKKKFPKINAGSDKEIIKYYVMEEYHIPEFDGNFSCEGASAELLEEISEFSYQSNFDQKCEICLESVFYTKTINLTHFPLKINQKINILKKEKI